MTEPKSDKPQLPAQYTLADPVQFAQNMAKVFEQGAQIAPFVEIGGGGHFDAVEAGLFDQAQVGFERGQVHAPQAA